MGTTSGLLDFVQVLLGSAQQLYNHTSSICTVTICIVVQELYKDCTTCRFVTPLPRGWACQGQAHPRGKGVTKRQGGKQQDDQDSLSALVRASGAAQASLVQL